MSNDNDSSKMPPPKFPSSAHSSIKKRKSKRSVDYGSSSNGGSMTSLGTARSAPVTPTSERSSSKVNWFVSSLRISCNYQSLVVNHVSHARNDVPWFIYENFRKEAWIRRVSDQGGQVMEVIWLDQMIVTVSTDLMVPNGLRVQETIRRFLILLLEFCEH